MARPVAGAPSRDLRPAEWRGRSPEHRIAVRRQPSPPDADATARARRTAAGLGRRPDPTRPVSADATAESPGVGPIGARGVAGNSTGHSGSAAAPLARL